MSETPADPGAETSRWTVVVPFYNERDYLPATVRSLAAQTAARPERKVRLVLVDNASTDGSADLARAALAGAEGVEVEIIEEAKPGQVHALETGIAATETELVAICDADTIYPPHYLETAERVFDAGGPEVVAAMALGVTGAGSAPKPLLRRWKVFFASMLARQCHTGGYGQMFRTEALRAAGGYSKELWPYVLKDHELMHRMMRVGRSAYAVDLWCHASDRREDRTKVRWTLSERLMYHVVPYGKKDWFFYEFLAERLKRRKQDEINLRNRPWDERAGAA